MADSRPEMPSQMSCCVYNPSGRMPLTTYMKDEDLPAMEDYSMSDRTYRYFRGEVRYPFGYGLSYTSFYYETCPADTAVETGKPITYSVKVTNTGDRDGDEVVQLYVSHSKRELRNVCLCVP